MTSDFCFGSAWFRKKSSDVISKKHTASDPWAAVSSRRFGSTPCLSSKNAHHAVEVAESGGDAAQRLLFVPTGVHHRAEDRSAGERVVLA